MESTTVPIPHPIPHVVLRARRGWQLINFAELVAYRDLFYFLVWRDIKVRYAQSVLGFGWAIIQPVFQTGIFTLIFGRVVGLKPSGDVPYELFSFCATVPWTFFSTALSEASSSLLGGANMISKVYFPRLLLPLTSVIGKLVDFCIAFVLLGVVLAVYRWVPTWNVLMLPLLVLMMAMAAAGLGMWLTAMAIQYRDVRYAMTFAINLIMWASPVIYSTYDVPEQYRLFYALNPMVGVIEGFRSALLGNQAMPWDLLGISALVSSFCFATGALYFRRMERVFADVA